MILRNLKMGLVDAFVYWIREGIDGQKAFSDCLDHRFNIIFSIFEVINIEC